MNTETFNIEARRGETYAFLVEEFDEDDQPLSNVGYTGKLQVRTSPDPDLAPAIITLTAGDGLTPGGVDGTTMVRFGADHTALLTVTCFYDLRYVNDVDPTDVRFPVTGTITAEPRVTQ